MEKASLRIVKSIASQDPKLAEEIRDSLIGRVAAVMSFDDAGWLLWAISELDGLTPVQINHLLRNVSNNGQVYGSRSASQYIYQLIAEHKADIKKSILRQFREVSSS
jgi:hypothetical protein